MVHNSGSQVQLVLLSMNNLNSGLFVMQIYHDPECSHKLQIALKTTFMLLLLCFCVIFEIYNDMRVCK